MPFGLGPQRSTLVPSFCTSVDVTNVQVPTSCSLSDFCWATAWPGSKASPNTETIRTLRRFMAFLLLVFGTFVGDAEPLGAAPRAYRASHVVFAVIERRGTEGMRRDPGRSGGTVSPVGGQERSPPGSARSYRRRN